MFRRRLHLNRRSFKNVAKLAMSPDLWIMVLKIFFRGIISSIEGWNNAKPTVRQAICFFANLHFISWSTSYNMTCWLYKLMANKTPFIWNEKNSKQCPGHAFFHSNLDLSVNPPEGVDQGQKVLEMKNKIFSIIAKTAATPTFWISKFCLCTHTSQYICI